VTFLNHYSYAVASAIVLLVLGAWAFRRRTLPALAALAIAAAVLVGVDVAFRPGEPTVVDAAGLEAVLAGGRPALVEFYSNF
jgi:hypothetical protein